MKKLILMVFLLIVSQKIYCQIKIDTISVCKPYIVKGSEYKYKYNSYKELEIIKDSLISRQFVLKQKECDLDKKLLKDKINLSNKKSNKKLFNGLLIGSILGLITGFIID